MNSRMKNYIATTAAHNAAIAKYNAAVAAYRNRTIGDSEYLEARKEYLVSTVAFDLAFAKAAGHEAA